MAYHSIIRNFANLGILQLEALRSRFSLSMSRKMLQFCGAYYKNQAQRDPFVDELCMLDKLVSARRDNGYSIAPTEFLANDAFLARTYADLLKKHKQLLPDQAPPCTFGDAINVATRYIQRTKGTSPLAGVRLAPENVRDALSYPDATCISAPGSAYRLRLLPPAAAALAEGDTLILMAPAANDSSAQFRRKTASVLQDAEVMQFVKNIATVGHGGILCELLKMTDSALIHLSALSPIDSSMPATVLCEGFYGCRILRVSLHQWHTVVSLLTKSGVRALPFAQIRQDPKFVFVRDKKTVFSLDAQFLHSLNQYQSVRATLSDEAELAPGAIAFGGIGGGRCSYLATDTANSIGEVAKVGTTFGAAVFAEAVRAPYKTALWSVIAPVTALCMCGIPYSNQALSLAMELPATYTEPAIAGNCLATILGLYRAQAELGLSVAGEATMRVCQTLENPTLTTWTLANNAKAPAAVFQNERSFVYALSPSLDKDGLPDFAALRQMLAMLTKLSNEDKILSCRVLVGEAVTDGIRKMSTNLTCLLEDVSVAAEGKIPLCVLIESEDFLPLHRIGTVRPFKRLPKKVVEIPERTALIPSEHPEIVIVAPLCDSNAMALAAHLEERGANVSLFTMPLQNTVTLARAMLTTQTLILCAGVTLPEEATVNFALDTLRRAGGILLSLSKKTANDGFVALANGIDEEILKKICPIE